MPKAVNKTVPVRKGPAGTIIGEAFFSRTAKKVTVEIELDQDWFEDAFPNELPNGVSFWASGAEE